MGEAKLTSALEIGATSDILEDVLLVAGRDDEPELARDPDIVQVALFEALGKSVWGSTRMSPWEFWMHK